MTRRLVRYNYKRRGPYNAGGYSKKRLVANMAMEYGARKAIKYTKKAFKSYAKNKLGLGTKFRDEGGVSNQHDYKTTFVKRSRPGRTYKKNKRLRNFKVRLDNAFEPLNTNIYDPSTMDLYVDLSKNQTWGFMSFGHKADIDKTIAQARIVRKTDDGGVVGTVSNRSLNCMVKSVNWEVCASQIGANISTNTPMILDIYYYICKKDVPSTEYANISDMVGANNPGLEAQYTSTDITDLTVAPSVSPFEVKLLSKYFTCYKKKQYLLNAGNGFTIQGTFKINKIYNDTNSANKSYYKGKSMAICYQLHSADYATGDGTKGKVRMVVTEVVRYKVVGTNAADPTINKQS